MEWTLAVVVAAALFFDFTNGFHDTANSIATSVSTRAMSPRAAVLSAAILNVVGAFASFAVAATVAKGIVNADAVTLDVLLGGLIGAIFWNLFTWYLGLPSSSSHALIGGISGAAIAASGWDAIQWENIVDKVVVPSLFAPALGILCAAGLMIAVLWLVRRRAPGTVNRVFRRLQLVSGGFVAFTHGTNDAQKTMGVISLALVTTGDLSADFVRPPTWVIVSSALAMGIGTYVGGWRIIKTLGTRIAKLDPPQGFAAQTATASILWTTAHFGFPVSTTHVVSGSVLGAGATRRLNAVRWGVAGNILIAWVMTLPCAGLVGAAMEEITRLPGGDAILFAFACVAAAGVFFRNSWRSRRPEFVDAMPVGPPPY
jgi:PiT family inorganic phosphate transporter